MVRCKYLHIVLGSIMLVQLFKLLYSVIKETRAMRKQITAIQTEIALISAELKLLRSIVSRDAVNAIVITIHTDIPECGSYRFNVISELSRVIKRTLDENNAADLVLYSNPTGFVIDAERISGNTALHLATILEQVLSRRILRGRNDEEIGHPKVHCIVTSELPKAA